MKQQMDIGAGDVFRFGDRSAGYGYGQIISSDTLQYIVIFKEIFAEFPVPALSDLVKKPLLLAGWTMDARFRSRSWTVQGHTEARPSFELPNYRVLIRGTEWLTDFLGKPIRPITDASERGRFRLKAAHSPIAYEKAFWAHHGQAAWEERFDELLLNEAANP